MSAVAYHVTSTAKLASIRKEGLRHGSYWTISMPLAEYYAETVEDEGEDPIILVMPLALLAEQDRTADHNGISEPIMSVVREISGLSTEQQVWNAWEASSQSSQASVDLIGSFVFINPIPSDHLLIMNQYLDDVQFMAMLSA
ncbi:hypothetical protein RYA05_03130 [Pseudomonas syringae pv. actinidiae]|nr:hypothetical protein [Pseudomonas syringae pv. actinidiae]